MEVFGSKISYFTGKFETYLRLKGIPYRYRRLDVPHYRWVVPRALGATQYPSVRLEDGRWMSDTTPMIAWLERRRPEPEVVPAEPVARFVALLVEDYADEWLWRPAMCIRWSHKPDRYLASTRLAEEVVVLPLPLALRRLWVARRQTKLFVSGDGIDAATVAHAEGVLPRLLKLLEPLLSKRPYLLGERPTVADVGLMGPFWRHFVHDPTPARIIQNEAPAVYEWAARTWNAGGGPWAERPPVTGAPDDMRPLLAEIAGSHLEALCANAAAHVAGAPVHSFTVQGTTYRDVPTSAYRVWCLEQLRARFDELPAPAAGEVETLLRETGCWEPLWRVEGLRSGHDPDGEAPFCKALRMVRD